MLSRLSGWYRVGVLLSGAWLFIGGSLYAMAVRASDFPNWYPVWRFVFPLNGELGIFESRCFSTGTGENWWATSCSVDLSVLGLFVFWAYPVLLGWVLGLAIAWAKRGFGQANA